MYRDEDCDDFYYEDLDAQAARAEWEAEMRAEAAYQLELERRFDEEEKLRYPGGRCAEDTYRTCQTKEESDIPF